MADVAEITERHGALAARHAGVVARRPARAGHGVAEGEVEFAGGGGVEAHGHGLGAAAAGAAEFVEFALGGLGLGGEVFELRVERLVLGGEFGAVLLEKREELGRFLDGEAGRAVLGGRGGGGDFEVGERTFLRFQDGAAVVEHAALFGEGAEFVLDGFHALVGREIDVGGARGHVEDGGLRGAAAGDLERLVEEGGGEFFERDLDRAGGREVERGRAGDDRAVGVNGHGVNAGSGGEGCGGGDGDRRGGKRERGEQGGWEFHEGERVG